MDNQSIQHNTSDAQVIELNTISELESFLVKLQESATDSLAAALNAQLQVIRYINSPELVNITFDTLFQNLEEAKRYAISEKEKDMIADKGAMMIQNYIFFAQAKLTFLVEENNKKGHELFEKAGEQLIVSITKIIELVIEKKTPIKLAVSKNIINNLDNNKNLFSLFSEWWYKKKYNAKKREDFIDSLSRLVDKLNKHKDIIGQSIIMSGLIENYKVKLINYKARNVYNNYIYTDDSMRVAKKNTFIASFVTFGFGLLLFFLRWVWHNVSDMFSVKSWFSDSVEELGRTGWVFEHFKWTTILTVSVFILFFCYFLYKLLFYIKAKKKYYKEWESLELYYNKIITDFE